MPKSTLNDFVIGPVSTSSGPSVSLLALSTTSTWIAFSFIASDTQILAASVPTGSPIVGTPASVVAVGELHTDNAGVPDNGAALASATVNGVLGNSILRFSGFGAHTLTVGSRYWIVIKCTSAPTHYPNIAFIGDCLNYANGSTGMPLWGWAKMQTTDGSSWGAGQVSGVAGLRVDYTSGLIDGLSITNATGADNGASGRIYSGHSVGAEFVTPDDVILSVIGVTASIRKAGAPTGTLQASLYVNRAFCAASLPVPIDRATTSSQRCSFQFAAPISIPPRATVSVLLDASAGDSTTNYVYFYKVVYENTLESLEHKPFQGTMQKVELAGSVWTLTPNEVPWLVLRLANAPFAVRPINRRYR